MIEKTRRELGHMLVGGAAVALSPSVPERNTWPGNTIEREIEIFPEEPIGLIRPELHGQLVEQVGTCIYGGLWVGSGSKTPNLNGYRQAALEALRALEIPVLRWPGGCFADAYHWTDGVGAIHEEARGTPRRGRETRFGTHEFIGLCQLIGARAYLAGNVNSGTPEELRDWMEYCNLPSGSALAEQRVRNGAQAPFNVKYWGIGSQHSNCGGPPVLEAQAYGEWFRRFGALAKPYGEIEPVLITHGPKGDPQGWTEHFLREEPGKRLTNAYAMNFTSIAELEETILRQRRVMDIADRKGNVGLVVDEWSTRREATRGAEGQQVTMQAAVSVALGLNAFHRQADKLLMCNSAQMVNLPDAMLLTEGDRCIRTATYYSFVLAKAHRGRLSVKTSPPQANETDLSVSASLRDDSLVVTMVNPRSDATVRARCSVRGHRLAGADGRSLFHRDGSAFNSFEEPDAVVPHKLETQVRPEGLLVNLPALSVTTIKVELRV